MTPGTILAPAPATVDGTIDPLVRRHHGAGDLDDHDGAPDRSSPARRGRSHSRMRNGSEDSFPHLAMLPPPPRLNSTAAALPKSPALGQSLDSIATPAPLSPLSASPVLPTERTAIPDIPPLTKATAKNSTAFNHGESSESLRRPSLPLLLDKARNANTASSIKAALVRNANFSPHIFRTKPPSDGQLQTGAGGGGGGGEDWLADTGSSSEVPSSNSAASRRLAAKKSVSNLLRKAANGLSTGAAKIDSRRRSSSSISSASISSMDANGAPQVPMGRASFSHHSNPPVSAFAVRKGSSPTPSVFSRRMTYYEDDADTSGSRRRANSSASLSGNLLRRRSQREKGRVAPTGEAQSDHEVALRSVPPSPLRRDPSSFTDLPGPKSPSGMSPPPVRTPLTPLSPSSPTQSPYIEGKLAALTLASDRPLTRDRRSHSTPHVTQPEPHFSSQPMSARGATTDSLSVEAHQDLLLKYADQFASQGAAPAGNGGETVTLAQQLIAVGEALAAERLSMSRSGSGRGGVNFREKGEIKGGEAHGAVSSSALPSVQEHRLHLPPSPMDGRI